MTSWQSVLPRCYVSTNSISAILPVACGTSGSVPAVQWHMSSAMRVLIMPVICCQCAVKVTGFVVPGMQVPC